MKPEEKEIADQSHIYLVCRRPSLRYDPSTFTHSDETAKGELIYLVDGIENRAPFSTKFPLLDGAKGVAVSPYPHRELRTFDADGEYYSLPASQCLEHSRGPSSHKD